jgi:hypothetical protein
MVKAANKSSQKIVCPTLWNNIVPPLCGYACVGATLIKARSFGHSLGGSLRRIEGEDAGAISSAPVKIGQLNIALQHQG